MRRYMLLVKATPEIEAGTFPDEAFNAKAAQYLGELDKAGALVACERLEPSSQGKRVHYKDGKFTVTDGPFAETKELTAGFCLIQAKSLDEAVAWAKRMPFQTGDVDVRRSSSCPTFRSIPPNNRTAGGTRKRRCGPLRRLPGKPGTKRYMGLLKADRDTEAGVMPDEKLLCRHGCVPRRRNEVGHFPLRRRTPAQLARRTRAVLRQRSNGDRRPVRGNQGTGCGLCNTSVRIASRSTGVDQTLRAKWTRRDGWARKASASCGQLWSARPRPYRSR